MRKKHEIIIFEILVFGYNVINPLHLMGIIIGILLK